MYKIDEKDYDILRFFWGADYANYEGFILIILLF